MHLCRLEHFQVGNSNFAMQTWVSLCAGLGQKAKFLKLPMIEHQIIRPFGSIHPTLFIRLRQVGEYQQGTD